ncbi:MAG: hypothetical protein ABIA97_06305 [Candidatus Omnitrophota bacterium]
MSKRVFIFIIVLAVIVLFFSTFIIVMDRMTNKSSNILMRVRGSSKSGESRTPKSKFDVFKPKPQRKKDDLLYKPNIEYKFSGKEPVIDI